MEKKRKGSWFRSWMGVLFGEKVSKVSLMEEEQVQSPFRTMAKEFLRRKLTIIGLIGFFSMFLASTIIPIFFPLDLNARDAAMLNQPPSNNMMRIPRSIRGDISMLAAGAGYGVGIAYGNEIHVWGTVNTFAAPLLNPPQPGRPIRHVSAGPYHALVVTEDGYVYSWGNNNPTFEIHRVPDGTRYERMPWGVEFEENIQGRVVFAEAGMRITVAITDDGQLHTWGGIEGNRRANAAIGRVPRDETPISVASNLVTFAVLTEEGNVHILMQTPHGLRDVPEQVQGRAVAIDMTNSNAIALLDDGTLHIWGDPVQGAHIAVPEEIQGRITSFGAGRAHITAILDDGSVKSWGVNNNGSTNFPNLSDVVYLCIAGDHNYAMLSDGSVVTWGLSGFLFGTDDRGRCVFTRLWSAGRYSLLIGMVSVIVQGFIGILLGGLAGYFGGKIDMLIMRFGEILGSLPFLPIALIMQFRTRHIFRDAPIQGMMFLMLILGVLSWPPLMRLVRAQILQTKESEYVLAARALGVRQFRIIFRHIMPNVASAAIVMLTLALATSMLIEGTLSFIGFGVSEPVPTWGNMIQGATNSVVLRDHWWRWVFPAISLVTVALSINLVGDGLREATDPKAQGR